jgi:hypothetical protein
MSGQGLAFSYHEFNERGKTKLEVAFMSQRFGESNACSDWGRIPAESYFENP